MDILAGTPLPNLVVLSFHMTGKHILQLIQGQNYTILMLKLLNLRKNLQSQCVTFRLPTKVFASNYKLS